jgi:23S rRNA pseudouridine2605 synthase
MKERLQKILAQRGLCSRRRAEDLIREARVVLNGSIVHTVGTLADPATDDIVVDGKALPRLKPPRILALHKPVGYLCTSWKGREQGLTVFDLLPQDRRYFTIGRLDRDSSGLLLVTDDGYLAEHLAHPRYGTKKTYMVETDQPLTEDMRTKLRTGVRLEDGLARAEAVSKMTARRMRLTLIGGKKRQIRRMLLALGRRVLTLHRVEIGSFRLGRLPVGTWRELTESDIKLLTSPNRNVRLGNDQEGVRRVSCR